jgi:hypothetical protein
MTEQFSDTQGFYEGFIPNVSCSRTGLPCPAKLQIVKLYSEHLPSDVEPDKFDEVMNPALDKAKMIIMLSEVTVAANLTGCEGTDIGICPTRTRMNDSPTRKNVVSKIRTLRSIFN